MLGNMPYEAESRSLSLALIGDAMVNRRLDRYREPDYLAMIDILRSADLTISNLETQINEFEHAWAQKPDSISWQVGSPSVIDDLKWMGVGVVTTSNNHSYDYSEAGFLTTMRHLKDRGLPFAGGGTNLAEARMPALLDLPRGRVAFMGASSTFSVESEAGASRQDLPGKPGINALHHEVLHHVPKSLFNALVEAKVRLGYKEYETVKDQFHPHRKVQYDDTTEVRIFGQKFRLADSYDIRTTCSREDLHGIEPWIRGAGKQADWRIYSVHCHESGNAGSIHEVARETPPAFMTEFARWTIDQGCDLFMSSGPHFLRGIEIYKGRPIFYSLGNFIFHNETVQRQPEPAYRRQGLGHEHTPGDWGAVRTGDDAYGFAVDPAFFESVIAVCDYAGGHVKQIRLHPLELGFGRPLSQRGRPMLAHGEVASSILRRLQLLSAPFGTTIAIEEGIGIISL
jgi:poly-gamma-glutamate synthesis protein (capsule biosynthesis protein)